MNKDTWILILGVLLLVNSVTSIYYNVKYNDLKEENLQLQNKTIALNSLLNKSTTLLNRSIEQTKSVKQIYFDYMGTCEELMQNASETIQEQGLLLQQQITQITQQANIIDNMVGTFVPTKRELERLVDDFDLNKKYDYDNFNCVEFSGKMIEYLRENNIFSCSTHITYEDGDGHMIVAVETKKEVLYVEPQTNNIFEFDDLERTYNYLDEIHKITSCYGQELFED